MRQQSHIRTRIVVEATQTRVLRRRSKFVIGWCGECAIETRMMKLDDAAVAYGFSLETICRLVAEHKIHSIKGSDALSFICVNSLSSLASPMTGKTVSAPIYRPERGSAIHAPATAFAAELLQGEEIEISSRNEAVQNRAGWNLTQESFDRLLQWLDPDREQAGRKYETIRRKLIKVFNRYGWTTAEDLADESINRVTRKIDLLVESYVGNQEAYFIAVGRRVHLENRRRVSTPILPLPRVISEDKEPVYQRLELCMQQLRPEDVELILQYYQDNKQARIECRKRLAEKLGIKQKTLRLRAYRIRRTLQELFSQSM